MSRNRELSQFPEFLTVNDTYGSVGIGTSLTVSGIGTFENDLYVAGTLYAPSLNITGGATLGDDLTTRNISASGIVTVTGNTDLNGDLDVDGHTELDNVRISGVTTFQEDIYLGNDDRINLGGSNDLQIYHDGVNSYIVDSGLGDLYIRGTAAIRFQNAGGTENYAVFNDTGSTDLYYDNTKRLETTNTGINVTGNIVASGNVTVGGTLVYEDVTNVDSVGIATARSGLRITGGGLDVVGVATFNNGVDTLDVIGHAEVDQLRVSGVSTFVGIVTSQSDVFVGGTLYAPSLSITGGATLTDDLSVRNINASGIITASGNIDANGDLDVDGHTELDNLNVSGVSTFVGIVTSQSDVFVGNDLSVAGDARVVGVLTVGSSSVTIDGTTNTITVGTGATIHTTTVSINQLEVAGLSTFTGIGTFKSDLFVGGTLYTPALIVNGSSVGDDITTRNISASGIATVTGDADINGDLDVDGHTELDNVNIAGVLTATSAEFSGNVTVLGDLTYENVVNVDAIGIVTARSGVRITGGGLEATGVSTFSGNIDLNADLDVDGHAEFDNVNVSGVLTATSFVGDGSQLTGVSGFATALSDDATSPLNKIFKTPKSLYITPNTQIDVDVSVYEGSVAFVRENVIIVGSGATFHIGSGTTMRTNVLNLF
jgi:cytoskeletal protein CcmA (bactofilin family)